MDSVICLKILPDCRFTVALFRTSINQSVRLPGNYTCYYPGKTKINTNTNTNTDQSINQWSYLGITLVTTQPTKNSHSSTFLTAIMVKALDFAISIEDHPNNKIGIFVLQIFLNQNLVRRRRVKSWRPSAASLLPVKIFMNENYTEQFQPASLNNIYRQICTTILSHMPDSFSLKS